MYNFGDSSWTLGIGHGKILSSSSSPSLGLSSTLNDYSFFLVSFEKMWHGHTLSQATRDESKCRPTRCGELSKEEWWWQRRRRWTVMKKIKDWNKIMNYFLFCLVFAPTWINHGWSGHDLYLRNANTLFIQFFSSRYLYFCVVFFSALFTPWQHTQYLVAQSSSSASKPTRAQQMTSARKWWKYNRMIILLVKYS